MSAGRDVMTGRFVWPPSTGAPPPSPPPADSPLDSPWLRPDWPRPPTRAGLAIDEAERVFLGGGAASLEHRAARDGWRPDPIGRACWRCAGSVGDHEIDAKGCAACRASRPPWARFIRLGPYDGLLRDAIQELKYRSRRGVGRELGRLIGWRLDHELDALREGQGDDSSVIIVPVPISVRRRLQRGVDHTLVLARAASASGAMPVRRLLRRTHRPSQLSVPPSQREANVRGSIRARKGAEAPERGIVVVLDDVRTSGATMRAACRAVEGLGVDRGRIWACVGAVRDAPNRRGEAATVGGAEAGSEGVDRETFSGEDQPED